MFKENTKKSIVTLFKTVTYIMLWLTFMIIMKRVNYALGEATRTAVITSGSFMLVFLMMQHVYGNFEIGYKKSKPVFLTTMISILIADGIAAITMIIMGVVQFPIKTMLLPTFLHLIVIYILQGLLTWAMAHIGNELYFKLYEPSKTVIYNCDDFLYNKIYHHVESHDKQYEISGVYDKINLDKIQEQKIDTIFAVGLDSVSRETLLNHCYRHEIHLIYNARRKDILVGKTQSFVIDDILLIESFPKQIGLFQLALKRLIDILGAIVLLIISIPVFIIVGIAIKLDDGGPILYSQERLTKNGKVFNIYKFRSMKVNSGLAPATDNDERITKVGHVIRKIRIDELPQAINILKGDISIVGPRPEGKERSEMLCEEAPGFDLRLRVKGGLTGYAQIFGKYNTTAEMKLLLDLKYIENFSILEDIKLILQTFMVFIRPDSTEGFDTEDKQKNNLK